MTFRLVCPSTCGLDDGAAEALPSVEGVILPHAKHLYFYGRHDAIETPFHALIDRPAGPARTLFGLYTGSDPSGLGMTARLAIVRQHRPGEPAERIFKELCGRIGVIADGECSVEQDLRLIAPALDNSVSPELGHSVLWQADAATARRQVMHETQRTILLPCR